MEISGARAPLTTKEKSNGPSRYDAALGRASRARGGAVRLTYRCDHHPFDQAGLRQRDGYFDVYLDGELFLTTRRPLTDGARALLARGYDPDLLLAVRAENRDHDSFKPITIGEAAKWAVKEENKAGLRLRHWMPFLGGRDGRTGASSENGHPHNTPEEDRAVRGDRTAA